MRTGRTKRKERSRVSVQVVFSAVALVVSMASLAIGFWNARRSAIVARKPILVFDFEGESGWVLRNVGNGPALDVCVARKPPGGEWFDPVRVPPISKEAAFPIFWSSHTNVHKLGVTYADFEGGHYTSVCGDDLTEITDGSRLGSWRAEDVVAHWKKSPSMS
jgi:hypothetical protein